MSIENQGPRPTRSGSAGGAGSPRGGGQLTRKQRQVLTAIQRFSTLQGYMPSVRELGRELGGLAPATVQHHLSMLRKKGHLTHDGGAHGLRLAGGIGSTDGMSTQPGNSMSDAAVTSLDSSPAASTDEPAGGLRKSGDGGGGGGGGRNGGGAGDGNDAGSWGLEIPGMQVVAPLLGSISAGRPLEAVEETDEYVPIPASLAKGSCFVLRVAGDSMVEDAILDGDLVVVQSCDRVNDGEIAVALLPDGTATLKRLFMEEKRVRLQPANGNMEPIYVDEVRVRGRVVGLVRTYQ
jgi:SOS-response transcriptional repressor LexA